MAEEATYLNVSASQATRPTIFELISQDGMQQCLKPAIQLMCRHLTQSKPEIFTKFYDYFDELYLLFDLFLEGHYIWTRSASFGEYFYGLKRVNCLSFVDTFLNINKTSKNEDKLNLRSRVVSLIGLCVLPYFLSKTEKYYQRLQEKDWDYLKMTKREEIFFRLYPYLDALTQISNLILKFLYLTQKTDFHSLPLILQSLKLTRETDDTLRSNFPYFAQLSQRSLFLNLVLSPLGAANLIGYGFTHLLPFGIFLIKFLRHWYAQHGHGVFEFYDRLPIPPPPAKSDQSADSDNCPLCKKEFHQPSVVAVSGWVYCYSCITNQLRTSGKCPMSGMSADIDDVIRVYAGSDYTS